MGCASVKQGSGEGLASPTVEMSQTRRAAAQCLWSYLSGASANYRKAAGVLTLP